MIKKISYYHFKLRLLKQININKDFIECTITNTMYNLSQKQTILLVVTANITIVPELTVFECPIGGFRLNILC